MSQSAQDFQRQMERQQQQGQQSGQQAWGPTTKTLLQTDASVPNPSIASQLTQEFAQLPGVNEVAYRRTEGRVRISFSAEALPMITQLLQRVGQQVQQAHNQQSYAGIS